MNILLTGAGGFLGKQILSDIGALGWDNMHVTAVSSQADALRSKSLKSENKNRSHSITYAKPREALSESELFKGAIVINCAFPRTVDGRNAAAGIRYVSDILQTSIKGKASGVINVSSQSVYSKEREHAATEFSFLSPESPYALAKFACELLTEAYCLNKVPYTNVRLASLIGPRFDQRVVNKIALKAVNQEPITIEESGCMFGFMDVRDASNGLIQLALSNPNTWRSTYNLGNEKSYSLTDIANSIERIMNSMDLTMPNIDFKPIERNKKINSEVDAQCFMNDFEWSPSFTLDQTVLDIVKAYLLDMRGE